MLAHVFANDNDEPGYPQSTYGRCRRQQCISEQYPNLSWCSHAAHFKVSQQSGNSYATLLDAEDRLDVLLEAAQIVGRRWY